MGILMVKKEKFSILKEAKQCLGKASFLSGTSPITLSRPNVPKLRNRDI